MTKVLAPVLPHLAEEITTTLHGPEAPSVFTIPWAPLVRIITNSIEADVHVSCCAAG